MSNLKKNVTMEPADRQYFEFELDAATMATVKKLATQAGVTPFEMGVALLRERLATARKPRAS